MYAPKNIHSNREIIIPITLNEMFVLYITHAKDSESTENHKSPCRLLLEVSRESKSIVFVLKNRIWYKDMVSVVSWVLVWVRWKCQHYTQSHNYTHTQTRWFLHNHTFFVRQKPLLRFLRNLVFQQAYFSL